MIAALLLSLAQTTPDIFVYVLDDVAAADLALYGGPVSCPNIEALAAQGVSFTRAYSNPTCAPTRRAMLTGHWWVTGNGSPCPGDGADQNSPTLAEAFLPEVLSSYLSGLVGKWHVGVNPYGLANELSPIAHGFDFWRAGSPSNVNECGGSSYTNWLRVDADFTGHHEALLTTTHEGIAARQAFVSGWPAASSPKLAVVCPNLAHAPFHAPPDSILPPGYVVAPGPRGRYEAMIVASDFLLGQMLAKVNLATTIVVVVADNGTPPSVAPNSAKAKGTTFERGVRVPLVVAGLPVNAPGRSVGDLVHVVDIWATLIEVGSGSVPGGSPWEPAGVSLLPYLADQAHPDPHEWVLVGSRWGATNGDVASVRSDLTKLRALDAAGDGISEAMEFYDLVSDPGETVNLIADPAWGFKIVEHMAWMAQALP